MDDDHFHEQDHRARTRRLHEFHETKKAQCKEGEEIEHESDITNYPLIIFYPSGENSGAELMVYRNEYIQKISISQNGKIINETELK